VPRHDDARHPCKAIGLPRILPAMAIKLQEPLREIFYAPFYVALARGAPSRPKASMSIS